MRCTSPIPLWNRVLVMVSALVQGGGARVKAVSRKWGIPVITLSRWLSVVARDVCADPGVALETGRAGGAARGGAAAVCAG